MRWNLAGEGETLRTYNLRQFGVCTRELLENLVRKFYVVLYCTK